MPTQSLPTISFDRDALGIVEKAQWTDAVDLGQLGAALGALHVTDVAQDLPEGDNSGVGALRARLEDFRTRVQNLVQGCLISLRIWIALKRIIPRRHMKLRLVLV